MAYEVTLRGDKGVSWFEVSPPLSANDLQVISDDPKTSDLKYSLDDTDAKMTCFEREAESFGSSYEAFREVEKYADLMASVLRQAGVACTIINQSGYFERRRL